MIQENFPAPWNLKGEGFIIPFIGNKKKILDSNILNENEKNIFCGGLGAIMFVNYSESNVGPYYELLFIPGDFKYKNKKYKRITKIFVSSEVSVREGIKNWAIPKQFADFTWEKKDNQTKIVVSKDNRNIISIDFQKYFLSYPITTSIYPVKLLQEIDSENFYITKFQGNGKGMIGKINSMETNGDLFPDLSKISRFHFTIPTENFQISFPIPEKIK